MPTEDADGNRAETTYDLEGRPVTSKDNKGSQTIRYHSVSGLPVELEDSAAGIFTASYDADGNLVARTLPDGLTAETTFNAADEPMSLNYTKSSYCGASSTWLDFNLERSISGQILTESGQPRHRPLRLRQGRAPHLSRRNAPGRRLHHPPLHL